MTTYEKLDHFCKGEAENEYCNTCEVKYRISGAVFGAFAIDAISSEEMQKLLVKYGIVPKGIFD